MVVDPPELHIAGTGSPSLPFLLLHAFANGTTALTGVEAISNGITAFKEPRSRNAGITLIWMSIILGSLFLGISYLTSPDRAFTLMMKRSFLSWPALYSMGAGCSIWRPLGPQQSS